MVDYFAVFGLNRRASDREIREAYRRLAKRFHPDPNPGDPGNSLRMAELNEAKSVLFDPIKREEHRVMLGLSETFTKGHLDELRRDVRFRTVSQHRPPHERAAQQAPRTPWDKNWRRYFIGIVGLALAALLGTVTYEIVTQPPPSKNPIADLIARYKRLEAPYRDTTVSQFDTMTVADDTAYRLKRHGDILFQLGEYRSASKYYEKYLRAMPEDDTVMRNLSYAYFRRGRYAEALTVLSKQMQGDSNLVVAYYNIGEMFLADQKPFDARDAFAQAVHIADTMRRHGRATPLLAERARHELARLE